MSDNKYTNLREMLISEMPMLYQSHKKGALPQEKKVTDSLGLGLENLANRYRLLAQKDIIIEKDELKFSVKLPLL